MAQREQLELQNTVGPITLPLKVGGRVAYFTLHYYEHGGQRWASAELGPLSGSEQVPLRIESACFFGHVFHSQQCDCGFQLDEAIRRIGELGRGLVIYGIDQDARGLGIEKHFRIYDYRQNENLDTDEVYRRFHAPLDSRSYAAVAAILRFLGVSRIRLMSNNSQRLEFLRSEGFQVERDEIEAPLTPYNMATMMLEKEDLNYQWSFRTHADWLKPLQAKVADEPDLSAACLVQNNDNIVAEWQGYSWDVAQNLLSALRENPGTGLVAYVSDLPRLDELERYAAAGVGFVVVPFPEVPKYLQTEGRRHGIKVQDWGRDNKYQTPRPQWQLESRTDEAHTYERGGERRTVQVHRSGTAEA